MRNKDSVSIPGQAHHQQQPVTQRSTTGAYSKTNINLSQPKLLTTKQSTATHNSTRFNSGPSANASLSQGRVSSANGYGAAAVTPSSRANEALKDHCFRMMSSSLANAKSGAGGYSASNGTAAAITHRSASRENVSITAGQTRHAFSRKSTVGKTSSA